MYTIVNVAINQNLGWFLRCHACIDNSIHSATGLQFWDECTMFMEEKVHEKPTKRTKISQGIIFPLNKFWIRTVKLFWFSHRERPWTADILLSFCLKLEKNCQLYSIVLCSISIGLFCFPNETAVEISVAAIKENLKRSTLQKIIFNVIIDKDRKIYEEILN